MLKMKDIRVISKKSSMSSSYFVSLRLFLSLSVLSLSVTHSLFLSISVSLNGLLSHSIIIPNLVGSTHSARLR